MQDWALILGSSSGFGAATCRELASRGVNIYGIHLDRKGGMDGVNRLMDDLKKEDMENEMNGLFDGIKINKEEEGLKDEKGLKKEEIVKKDLELWV